MPLLLNFIVSTLVGRSMLPPVECLFADERDICDSNDEVLAEGTIADELEAPTPTALPMTTKGGKACMYKYIIGRERKGWNEWIIYTHTCCTSGWY